MLQETLKQATQKNHEELEQLMFVQQIMSGTLTLQQYKTILTTNYIVHKAIEDMLFNGLDNKIATRFDLKKRNKLTALTEDLKELHMQEPAIDQDFEPMSFEKNDAEILGALYVLEGATLGGSVIVKKLKINTNLNNLDLGFHYYQIYGSELINYWKSFCAVLDQQAEDTFADSVSGAQKMFDYIAAVSKKESNLPG